MSARISIKDCEGLVKLINQMNGQPIAPYTKLDAGGYKVNIGNYHIDSAYGGHALHQMMNDGGGVHDISACGYMTKAEFYQWLRAFIRGLETSKV